MHLSRVCVEHYCVINAYVCFVRFVVFCGMWPGRQHGTRHFYVRNCVDSVWLCRTPTRLHYLTHCQIFSMCQLSQAQDLNNSKTFSTRVPNCACYQNENQHHCYSFPENDSETIGSRASGRATMIANTFIFLLGHLIQCHGCRANDSQI